MIGSQLIVFGCCCSTPTGCRSARPRGGDGRDGLYIGLAQVLALAPGTSRSGITITAGRWLGLDRDGAARFSFLMLIPIVAGATVFKARERDRRRPPPGVGGPMIVGTIAAAISGYLAIAFLLRLAPHSEATDRSSYYRYRGRDADPGRSSPPGCAPPTVFEALLSECFAGPGAAGSTRSTRNHLVRPEIANGPAPWAIRGVKISGEVRGRR